MICSRCLTATVHPGRRSGDRDDSTKDRNGDDQRSPAVGVDQPQGLADALCVTVDTLGRWEARRFGPPCVRAGRMVLYRRRVVQDWLGAQEMPRAKVAGGRK